MRAAAIFPMRIMGIVTPIIAVAMILSEGLFGAGNTKFVAVAQFVLVFGWLVPGAYVLGIVLHLALERDLDRGVRLRVPRGGRR